MATNALQQANQAAQFQAAQATAQSQAQVATAQSQASVAGTAGVKPPKLTMPDVPNGHVAFVSSQPPVTLICKLGASSATRSGGIGGWEAVSRPGLREATRWSGQSLRQLTVPLLFDGLRDRTSVEQQVAALVRLGQPEDDRPRNTRPPVLRVSGMVPHDGIEWVLQDVQFEEATWFGMTRVRQWATATLLEHVPVDLVPLAKKKKAGGQAGTYTVKKGDTLGSIAKDELGARTLPEIERAVRALKELNDIRDPKSIKPGQKLKLPKASLEAQVSKGEALAR
jgi:nucleoid-associated protein YgaU